MGEYLLPTVVALVIYLVVGAVVWAVVEVRRGKRESKKLKASVKDAMRQLADLAGVVADQSGSPEVAAKAKAIAARLRAGATAEGAPRKPSLLSAEEMPDWEHQWAMECEQNGWRDPNTNEPLSEEEKSLAKERLVTCRQMGWTTKEAA